MATLRLLQELLAAGADVSARSNDRETALMVASNRGHREIVKQLIKSGAQQWHPDRRIEGASLAVTNKEKRFSNGQRLTSQ